MKNTEKNKKEITWSDYFGVDVGPVEYLPFEEAREFARALGFKSSKEWKDYCALGNKPASIPSNPYLTYTGPFKGIHDWLGYSKTKYLDFYSARRFVHSLKIEYFTEWQEHIKLKNRPPIPQNPKIFYDEFVDWYDWYGVQFKGKKYNFMSFEEARDFSRSLNLSGKPAWEQYRKRKDFPVNIPSNPNRTYRGKWDGWSDWLGTKRNKINEPRYFDFSLSREMARSLNLKKRSEWLSLYSLRPIECVPKYPDKYYRDEFVSWFDWLVGDPMSLEETLSYIKREKIKTNNEFEILQSAGALSRRFPPNPKSYFKEFQEWEKILPNEDFLNYKECSELAIKNNMTSKKWKAFARQYNIDHPSSKAPTNPDSYYKKEWISWMKFLNNSNNKYSNKKDKKRFVSLEEFGNYLKENNINSATKWSKYCASGKKPINIPCNPRASYGKEWKGWGKLLGEYYCKQ